MEFRPRRQSRGGERGPRRAPIDERHPRSGEPGFRHGDPEEADLGPSWDFFRARHSEEDSGGRQGCQRLGRIGVVSGRTMPSALPSDPPKRIRWREPPDPLLPGRGNLSRRAKTTETRVLVLEEWLAVIGQMHRGGSPRAVERQVEGVRPSLRRNSGLLTQVFRGGSAGEKVPRARS